MRNARERETDAVNLFQEQQLQCLSTSAMELRVCFRDLSTSRATTSFPSSFISISNRVCMCVCHAAVELFSEMSAGAI